MIDKVYIVHYSQLTDRKLHMINEMFEWFPNTEVIYIEDYDQEELEDNLINEHFDIPACIKKFDRELTRAEMSLCLKFKEVFRMAAAAKDENVLVLEDDVIFKEDPLIYLSRIQKYCKFHKILPDALFLGEALIRKGDDRNLFMRKSHPATNGLCTVMYPKSTMQKLHDYFLTHKIYQPMDWQLNDVFQKLDLEIYWGKAITKHGSVLAAESEEYQQLKSVLRNTY